MSNLAVIHDALQSHLREDDDVRVELDVAGSESVPVITRLALYPHVRCRQLVDALEANYPALAAMLGPGDFDALGTAYASAHPSRFFAMRWYGDALPQFLATDASYAGAPVLADLARWEWTMTEVLDAGDAEPLGAAVLESTPAESWAGLRFDLHPSVRTLELQWNAPQIWQSLAGDLQSFSGHDLEQVWPAPAQANEPQAWLLWRRDLRVLHRPLSPFEAAGIEYCRRGYRFGEICDLAAEWLNGQDASACMMSVLRAWIDAGLIVRARLR